MLILDVDVMPGDHISVTIDNLISTSQKLKCCIRSKFNGVHLFVTPNSKADDILNVYNRNIKNG